MGFRACLKWAKQYRKPQAFRVIGAGAASNDIVTYVRLATNMLVGNGFSP